MFISVLVFVSCTQTVKQKEKNDHEFKKAKSKNSGLKFSFNSEAGRIIFYGLYSPVEISNILGKSNIEYAPEFFLPVENASQYTSSSKIAVNLGVYGADFSMTKMFENTEDAVKIMDVIYSLSDKLGIPSDLISGSANRVEQNFADMDSLAQISYQTFEMVTDYLVDNGRESAVSLILLGGWIEGLYTSTMYLNNQNEPNQALIEKIIEQKYSLYFLMAVLKNHYNDPAVAYYHRLLKVLHNHFENLVIKYKEGQMDIDAKHKLIKSDWNQYLYSTEEIDKITTIVKTLREIVTES